MVQLHLILFGALCLVGPIMVLTAPSENENGENELAKLLGMDDREFGVDNITAKERSTIKKCEDKSSFCKIIGVTNFGTVNNSLSLCEPQLSIYESFIRNFQVKCPETCGYCDCTYDKAGQTSCNILQFLCDSKQYGTFAKMVCPKACGCAFTTGSG